MVDVCLAGTGGMMPLKNRWLTSFYMEYNGRGMLIDCGEGTQIALSCVECKLSRIDVIFITHFHADHISGLSGLLLSLGNFSKTTPLTIYTVEGGAEIIKSLMCISKNIPYEVIVKELPYKRQSFTLNEISDMIDVDVLPLKHRVECFGYSFKFRRKAIFNPEKAKALGVPLKFWKTLHSGESVNFDGMTVTQDMVTDGQREPVKITYVTDTMQFPEIADFAAGSDLFISEGMYGDDSMADEMFKKGHSLFNQSARTAKTAGVKELWLTHYSPALTNPQDYESSVRKIFANTVVCRDGCKKTL